MTSKFKLDEAPSEAEVKFTDDQIEVFNKEQVGRHDFEPLNLVLRDDAAEKWNKAIADVKSKGGIIIPAKSPYYSDTIRYPKNGFTDTGGNSKLSFHYTGRAVDTTQSFAGGKNWRWWIVKETVGSKTMFRIYCKTDKQPEIDCKCCTAEDHVTT